MVPRTPTKRGGRFEVTGKEERKLSETRGTRWNPDHREMGSLRVEEAEEQDKCSGGRRLRL